MNSYIDATYVINMDNDKDRLIEFDKMMKGLNWSYNRQVAIHGKKIFNREPTEPFDNNHLTLKNKYLAFINLLTHTEIGCLLSHVAIWEQLINNDKLNRIAIFEDDARTHITGNTIHQNLNGFYQYLTANKLAEPDILYLGKCLDTCFNYQKVYGHIYRTYRPLCFHAYIINKAGAKKLFNLAPFSEPADMIPISLIKNRSLVAMTFHPSLFFQDVMNTTSNLRSLGMALNNNTECIVTYQQIPEESAYLLGIIIFTLIVAIILFLIFISYTSNY